jgi:hypothetical protein
LISIRTGLIAALLLIPSGVALADTIFLTNGRSVTGIATEEKDRVTIDHGCGKISIPRSMVARIERDAPAAIAPSGTASVGTASRGK